MAARGSGWLAWCQQQAEGGPTKKCSGYSLIKWTDRSVYGQIGVPTDGSNQYAPSTSSKLGA